MDAAARALSAAARSLSSLLGPERRLKFVEEAAMRAVREIWYWRLEPCKKCNKLNSLIGCRPRQVHSSHRHTHTRSIMQGFKRAQAYWKPLLPMCS